MMNPSQHVALPAYPSQDEEVSIASYLTTLIDYRRLIIGVAVMMSLLAAIAAYTIKPVYESNLLIHVEEGSQKESKNILGDLNSLFESKTAASAEIELLRSRLVISRAIDNLRLYIQAEPKYFPLIGSWIASHRQSLASPGILGLGGYAWGTESISAPRFDVPEALQNLSFTLIAGKDGQYSLRQAEKKIDLQGRVGTLLEVVTNEGPLDLLVNKIDAHPGTQFKLSRSSRLSVIENIQTGLQVVELGKQSGVISATLQGDDAKTVSNVLNEIGREYVLQNSFRKTEESQKALALLEKQMPELKIQLEQSEANLNQFRHQHGTVDLGEEARLSLQQSAAAKLRKIDLEQKKADFLNRFTLDHPAVIGINSQINEINGEIKRMTDHIRTLPSLEQEVLRLNRDVKVNTDLYTALLNTAQQLRLIALGKNSNVRLVDNAMVPEKPVSPNRPKYISLGFVLGLMGGVIAAFTRKALRDKIEDPSEIEKLVGVPVFATIPHSQMQTDLLDHGRNTSKRLPLLACAASTDVAIESLRHFHTALDYAMRNANSNTVLIAGPTSGMGKTFVSVNLAAVLAASGKRVLLIDADFRNGHLHRYFELSRMSGLADYLTGGVQAEHMIHRGVIENLDFISTGSLPANPAELLMRPALGIILHNLSHQYDVVLIDATPILPVADSLIIGAHVGSIYIMTRAGMTTPGEVSESIKRLVQAGLTPKGVLFNDLKLRPGRYGYGYKYGQHRVNPDRANVPPMIEARPA